MVLDGKQECNGSQNPAFGECPDFCVTDHIVLLDQQIRTRVRDKYFFFFL